MPLIQWAAYQKRRASKKQIEKWFKQWPDANIGIVTGRVSNLVVIDIDPRNGGNLDEVGRTVSTDLMSTTPSGGVHLWCVHPGPNVKIVSRPDEFQGVDIQADGKLVVAPPSTRGDREYKWEREGEPGTAPTWILASPRRRAREEQGDKEEWISKSLEGVPEGSRHDALARLTGYFIKQQIPKDVALGLLTAWNQKNSVPLPTEEIAKTVNSLYDEHGTEGKVGPARFFKKNRFIPAMMGDAIRENIPLVTVHQQIYMYKNGVYVEGEDWIASQVAQQLGQEFTTTRVNEVLNYLRFVSKRGLGEPVDFSYINVLNGNIEVETGELVEHDPEIVSFAQLPHSFVAKAKCPHIDAFVEEVLEDDCHDLLYEIVGYSIYSDLPFREAIVLTGPTASGKSVLLGIIRALLGRKNYSTVPVHSLADEKFHRAELVNKLANICGDLDSSTVRGAGIFKQITGGDTLMAERKGKDPFTFRNRATMIFSANAPPRGGDRSDAWYTRWLVLPMNKSIPREKQDPYLLKKLTTEPELEGLMAKSIKALQRLLERGRFDMPDSVMRENQDYRERTDPLAGWVDECVSFDGEGKVRRSSLYESFKQHAVDAGFYAIPPAHEIYRRLRLEYGVTFFRAKGIWYARGIHISETQTELIDG